MRNNSRKRRAERKKEAEQRQELRNARTNKEQRDLLDSRVGKMTGIFFNSQRERQRIYP